MATLPRVPDRKHCRVVRCQKCNAYLMTVLLVDSEPGSNAKVDIVLNCRNRKCKAENRMTIIVTNKKEDEA